jgi:hypothetical protein
MGNLGERVFGDDPLPVDGVDEVAWFQPCFLGGRVGRDGDHLQEVLLQRGGLVADAQGGLALHHRQHCADALNLAVEGAGELLALLRAQKLRARVVQRGEHRLQRAVRHFVRRHRLDILVAHEAEHAVVQRHHRRLRDIQIRCRGTGVCQRGRKVALHHHCAALH